MKSSLNEKREDKCTQLNGLTQALQELLLLSVYCIVPANYVLKGPFIS